MTKSTKNSKSFYISPDILKFRCPEIPLRKSSSRNYGSIWVWVYGCEKIKFNGLTKSSEFNS